MIAHLNHRKSHPLNTSLHVWACNCVHGVDPSDNNNKSEFVKKSVNWSSQDCNNALRMAIMHKNDSGSGPEKADFKRTDVG